jgi:hypothetical protein
MGSSGEEGTMRGTSRVTYPASAPIQEWPAVRRRRPSLLGEVWNGAVRGDFARNVGLVGGLTQIGIGFLPIIGTLAAMRDIVADLKYRDHLGCLFNGLALIPIVGGFSKTMDVLHLMAHAGHAVHISQRRKQQT